jgi:glycosyltransferase involved in cell wall biosynthesis
VRVIALAGDGLPHEEQIEGGVRVTRLTLDRRITSSLRPIPARARIGIARMLGLDPQATILPAAGVRGMDRLRYPVRRALELAAHVRRVGPWTDALAAAAPETDVFHTQALVALPVIRQAAQRLGARYVYDVADYQTEAARIARLPRLVRAVARRRERGWARQAAGLLAVSEPMADLVAARFGTARPGVVLNCPPSWRADDAMPPPSSRLRDELHLPDGHPIVLHHGQFKPGRGIEELVRAADNPALRALDPAFVLLGFGRLQPLLDDAARQRPGRVFVLPAVPPDELLDWVAGADVAYLGCPPVTLNLRLTIPNKLFEAMMAGVPVLAAQGTEQARLIAQEGVGTCFDIDSTDELAAALMALLAMPEPERRALRQHCRTLALTSYSWERRSRPLVDLYRRL